DDAERLVDLGHAAHHLVPGGVAVGELLDDAAADARAVGARVLVAVGDGAVADAAVEIDDVRLVAQRLGEVHQVRIGHDVAAARPLGGRIRRGRGGGEDGDQRGEGGPDD